MSSQKHLLKTILRFLPFAGVVIAVLFLFFLIYMRGDFSNQDNSQKVNFLQKRQFFSNLINEKGPEAAYLVLKNEYANVDFGLKHRVSHLFGDLLYEKLGTTGITVCDYNFGDFGCFHGFVISAILDIGEDAVMPLASSCRESLKLDSLIASCEHGIGHGVLEYFRRDRLVDALGECRKIAINHQSGCYKGVLMEYNVPAVSDGEKALRDFNEANPYDPCGVLDSEYQYACYFQLPQWWEKVMDKDYRKIGVLCSRIDDKELSDACYKGVGNVAAPSSSYDVNEVLRKCNEIPEARGKVYCRVFAARGFLSLEEHRRKAGDLCLGLPDQVRYWCSEDSVEIEQ